MAQPFLAMHIDTYFAGQLGTDHVGALGVAITSLVTWTWIVTAPIWAFGVQVGRSAAQQSAVRRHLVTSLLLIVASSVAVGAALWLLTDFCLAWAGGNQGQVHLGRQYHAIMACSLPVTAAYLLSVRMMLALNRYTEVFVFAAISLGINIAGNVIALYGLQSGLEGLAISVVVSQGVGAALSLWVAYRKGSNAEEKADHSAADQGKLTMRVVYAILGSTAVTVVYYVLGRLCNQLGPVEAAAHAKAYTLFLGIVYLTSGLVNITETKGYSLRVDDIRYQNYRRLQLWAAVKIGCAVSLVYAIPSLLLLYFSSPDVVSVLLPLLVISTLLQIPTTVLWSLFALLRSQALFGKSFVVESVSMIAFLASALAISNTSKAWMVWAVFSAYFFVRLGIAWFFTAPVASLDGELDAAAGGGGM